MRPHLESQVHGFALWLGPMPGEPLPGLMKYKQKLTSNPFFLLNVSEEEQETSGDFGSGGSVVLLDDLEDERELGPKDRLGKLRVHTRAVTEDDEDEDDDKEDEVGYIW